MRNIAIYTRVSSKQQNSQLQEDGIMQWLKAHGIKDNISWYQDAYTGGTMDRPEFNRLMQDIESNFVEAIIIWRIDRLGRSTTGLVKLFDQLQKFNVNLISIREGIDISTPGGKLVATVLAGVAQYDNEVRKENQRAGIEIAKAKGTYLGFGRKKGERWKVTEETGKEIANAYNGGEKIARLARRFNLSRPTVYKIISEYSCRQDCKQIIGQQQPETEPEQFEEVEMF